MARTLRTQPLAASLAALLFLSSSLPLVQHACMMANASMAMSDHHEPCCCDRKADAHAGHTLPEKDACPHTKEVPTDAQGYQQGDCCTARVQHTTADGVMLATVSLLRPVVASPLLVSPSTPRPPQATDPPPLLVTRPLPPGASLHVLYASFLN